MRFARPRHVLRPTGLVEALATNDSTPAHLGCCARQDPATGGSFAVQAQSIEQEGIFISGTSSSIHVSGSGNIVAGGDIYVSGCRGGVTIQSSGPSGGVVAGPGRCIVGIALPEAPSIRIKGSGDVTLYDLQQSLLDVGIHGSGDITAFGQVEHLDAEVAGSGDVDASELVATSAELSVAGSGDIDTYVAQSVKARVAGSGDIVVRGNPPIRNHSVAGSGKIKFKNT